MTVRYEFTDPDNFRVRTFLGKLVKAKDPPGTATIAQRILSMNVDVLAAQEVENIDILTEFNQDQLGGLINALANPTETRPAKAEAGGHDPPSPSWTHCFKPSGRPPEHRLFDQIWLSPALSTSLRGAFIDRRPRTGETEATRTLPGWSWNCRLFSRPQPGSRSLANYFASCK